MTILDSEAVAAPAPVPPAEARSFYPGPHDIAVFDCLTAMSEVLRPRHGPLDFERWVMPADTSWASVEAFYEAQRPGWAPERTANHAGCTMCAWFGAGDVLGVALTDPPFEAPEPFRVLMVVRRAIY